MGTARIIVPASCLSFPADHRQHRDAEIEWWYQFSFLDGDYTLMSCVWRYGDARAEGLMACYALTEIRGGRRWRGTWINPGMLKLAQEIMSRTEAPGLFTQGVMELTSAGNSFDPYRLAPDARLSSNPSVPLLAAVGPCEFRHEAQNRVLRLRWSHGELEADLRFRLDSVRFPMNCTGQFALSGRRMWGYSVPQSSVGGCLTIAGESQIVAGNAWLDHQWGDWTFEQRKGEFRHPEWHYFAAPFDDGTSLVVYLGKGATEPLITGCVCHADGSVRAVRQVAVKPKGRFRSLRTHNVYEYGWSVELPEFDARLEFTPFHSNHEVLTFSRERGLLELGVRVTGTFLGKPRDSLGFVETFGETVAIEEAFWKSRALTIDQIENFLPRKATPEWLGHLAASSGPMAVEPGDLDRSLLDPIWSMLERGGKTWRGTWFAQCCYALGYEGDDEPLRELLPVIELIHTGTLIIDDIQDGSPMRRGKPAVHLELGTDLAINAGNFLYFLPLLLIQDIQGLSDAQRLEAYQRIAVGQRQGHVGQALDLMWSKGRYDLRPKVRDFERTRAQLLEQYRLKCGCQLEAATRIAGTLAGAPQHLTDALTVYSNAFGAVYQIVDDLRDADDNDPDLGKPAGEDLRNGRLNMLLLYALHSAAPQRQEEAFARLAANDNGSAHYLRRLIAETGALEQCLAFAEQTIASATGSLRLLPATDARIILEAMPQYLLHERRKRLAGHV